MFPQFEEFLKKNPNAFDSPKVFDSCDIQSIDHRVVILFIIYFLFNFISFIFILFFIFYFLFFIFIFYFIYILYFRNIWILFRIIKDFYSTKMLKKNWTKVFFIFIFFFLIFKTKKKEKCLALFLFFSRLKGILLTL